MRKLLLITSNYWPEHSGIAVYSTDLAENAFTQTHEVHVLTGLPHYPWWKIPAEFEDLIPGKYQRNKVSIERVGHTIPRSGGVIGRVKLEFSFWRNARKAVLESKVVDFDQIVAIVPTVASALVARYFAKNIGAPYHVIIQDLSSVGAKESGMPGARRLAKISRFLERRAIVGASGIAIVSSAMAKPVGELTSNKVPITLIQNYSLGSETNISSFEGRARLGIALDEIVFLHSGNIGFKQDLLNVINAGKMVKNENIRIFIVGHGNQEAVIRSAITMGGNVNWLPSFSDEDYVYLLKAADVLLVNERSTQRSMSLPSKVTSYLSSGRPILAAVPKGGATALYLTDTAYLVPSGEPNTLALAMDYLAESPKVRAHLSKCSIEKYHRELSKTAAYDAYLKWL